MRNTIVDSIFPGESKARRACAVTDGELILATVDLGMPPERVFRALTTGEVEQWWDSVRTYHVTGWKAELRVGGRWSLIVRLPDGTGLPAGGEFLEIDPPHKIVQTRKYDWDHPVVGRRTTTVTYRLEPLAIGTRLIVRHEGFAGLPAAAAEHAAGSERFRDWLAEYAMPASASAAH
jgi:uncharacterized protein YndB with AHSA1/START domain